jgi:ABC-type transport system involved in multi-copper enzyme maturation permease subunit
MFNLLRGSISRHALFLALCLLFLSGFEFLVCGVVATVDVSGVLKEVSKSVPSFLQALLSEQVLAGMTARGLLAFGWNHPLALALGAAVAITLASRSVAGEIESGMMELLMSQPLSRRNYLLAHVLFAACALAGLSLMGALGTFLGQKYYGLNLLDRRALLQLALNFFLLQLAWYSLALLLSVHARESGRVTSAIFLLVLASFFAQVLGRLWSVAAFLLPYSLYSYYSPPEILVESVLSLKSLAVLGLVSALGLGVSFWRFEHRDLP